MIIYALRSTKDTKDQAVSLEGVTPDVKSDLATSLAQEKKEVKIRMKIETNCLLKDFDVDCKGIEISKDDGIGEINNLPDEDPRDNKSVRIKKIESLDDCRESNFVESEMSGVRS